MRAGLLAVALALAACARNPFSRSAPIPQQGIDSLYWRAVLHLDAANRQGSTDSAVKYLDAYLARDTTQNHRLEALILRRLSRNSLQLARVEAALQQAKAVEPTRARADTVARTRDDEMVKEVQRLKEELAKANEELERIRKRLAAPKPPTDTTKR